MIDDTNINYLLPEEPTRFSEINLSSLLSHTSSLGSSDVTIQTNEHIYAEIYGRLHQMTKRKLSNTEVGDLLNCIYGPNGTAQLLSGTDVDTFYEFKTSRTDKLRFRVNGTACLVDGHDGIQITLRTIPSTPPSLESMDLPHDLKDFLTPEEGIIYVTGATGSGKSTLLASIVRSIVEAKDSNRKVLTYESPIEFVYDNILKTSSVVSQSEIPRHLPSFSDGIRNALRRKPRLILVGESRDAETIAASLEAAMTGHPVYTTLHTNGVAETMRRLVTSFPAEERSGRTLDIIETMKVCLWQKLVPSTDGKRIALREYLIFNDSIREMLLKESLEEITETTRNLLSKYGRTMQQDIQEKFDLGMIDEKQYKILTRNSDLNR